MFSRALGSAARDLDDGVAQRVEATLEDQRGQQRAVDWSTPPADDSGSTARSTSPLCDSSHRPSVNGADADGFDRHADAGRAHRGHHAAAAQRGRHRGERRVTPQRRGAAPAPRHAVVVEEADAPAVGVHQAVLLPARRIRLHQQARTAGRAPATRPIRGSPSQPRCRHIRRPRPGARRRRSAAGSGGPSCGSSAAGCSARPPTSRRAAPCSRPDLEERLRVPLVDHRGEARPRPQRRRGPLPHVAEHLLGAVRRRACRVGADRGGAQRVAAEVGEVLGGFRCAPRESATPRRRRDPRRRPSPTPPRWAAARRPTPRTPRPRST